jgi:hypothetical protein
MLPAGQVPCRLTRDASEVILLRERVKENANTRDNLLGVGKVNDRRCTT